MVFLTRGLSQADGQTSWRWQESSCRAQVAWHADAGAYRQAQPGLHRRPDAAQAVADEHHLPGDPRGIETGNGAGAHQARAVEHHQRQRLAGDQQSANIQVRMRNPRQRAEAQPGTLIFGLPQQRQIQRLFRQRLAQRTIAIHPGDYPHLRMMPFKLPEDLRHQRFAKIFLHTKVDLAGEPLTLQRAQGFIIERQQASGVAHQLFAFRGEHQMGPCLVTSAAPH